MMRDKYSERGRRERGGTEIRCIYRGDSVLFNSFDKLIANKLTDVSTDIHYFCVVKNSIWQTARHYSDVLGGKVAYLNK